MFYTNVALIGNNMHMRYVENGVRKQGKFRFSPELFISHPNGDYVDLKGKPYKSKTVKSVYDARQYVKDYSVDGNTICGNPKPEFEFIDKFFKEDVSFDQELINIVYLDIEVFTDGTFPDPSESKFPINAISLRTRGVTYAFGLTYEGCGDFVNDRDDIIVQLYDNEETLLSKFIQLWTELEIDVISGWNSTTFDLPYICGRIEKVLGEDSIRKLSPFNNVYAGTKQNSFGQRELFYVIKGISQLDYLALYKKFTFVNRESYKLDFIAEVELGDHKEDISEFDNLFDLYEKDFQLFMDYNIKDTELVERLDDRLKFMDIALTLAYFSKVNYEDIFSPMRYWENIIQNYLYSEKIVVPYEKTVSEKTAKFEGAYVKSPITGKHEFMVSFDFTSLYPYIIRTFNISPETIEYQKPMTIEDILNQQKDLSEDYRKDVAVAANGVRFSRNRTGFIPTLVKRMLDLRVDSKKAMISTRQEIERLKETGEKSRISELEKKAVALYNMQLVAKVAANSFYGICGLKYFRFYDIRLAEAVTYSGQAVNRFVENYLNNYLNETFKTDNLDYAAYMDTDSIYFRLDEIVKKVMPNKSREEQNKFVQKVGYTKLSEKIDEAVDKFNKYLNVHEEVLNMKIEAVGSGVFIAKKKYVMSIVHMEGVDYATPKIKMTGVEAVKSSTPAPAREALTDCAKIVVQGTEEELIEYVAEFSKKWYSLTPEEIALPTSIKGIRKYHRGENQYKLGCPIHVRAGINYNYWLKSHKLENYYSDIKDGAKVKYVFLKDQNYTKENVIAFPNRLPKELELHDRVDFDAMWERAFISPLKIMLEPIKWHYEKRVNLMSLFS